MDVEVSPLESSFSPQLCEMMHKEDLATHNGRYDVVESIADQISDKLAAETARHFRKQAAADNERWRMLFNKQIGEQEQLRMELMEQIANFSGTRSGGGGGDSGGVDERSSTPVPGDGDNCRFKEGRELTLDERIDLEERRIRKHAMDNWAEHEQFNLSVAFDSQVRRLEDEWKQHETRMRTEFNSQRAALTGQNAAPAAAATSNRSPWKSKEKQSRLIHTAPVIEPTANLQHRKGTRSAEHELRQLEAAFQQASTRVARQKQSSLLWIRRQSLRMNAQVEGYSSVKRLCGRQIGQYDENFKSMRRAVREAAEKRASASGSESNSCRASPVFHKNADASFPGTSFGSSSHHHSPSSAGGSFRVSKKKQERRRSGDGGTRQLVSNSRR